MIYELPKPLGLAKDLSQLEGVSKKRLFTLHKPTDSTSEQWIINKERGINIKYKDVLHILKAYEIALYDNNMVHYKEVVRKLVYKVFKEEEDTKLEVNIGGVVA